MILLDTHIWLWYLEDTFLSNLTDNQLKAILRNVDGGLAVSIVSYWEVAKKHQIGKLVLNKPLKDWFQNSLKRGDVKFLDITPNIILDSVQLPGTFHKDPFDQLIVATARIYDCPLVIRKYSFVKVVY